MGRVHPSWWRVVAAKLEMGVCTLVTQPAKRLAGVGEGPLWSPAIGALFGSSIRAKVRGWRAGGLVGPTLSEGQALCAPRRG